MGTTTILHEFEKHMNERVISGEIAEATFDSYLNDASRVFETLLRNIPGSVIEGYMKAEGYRGDYRFIIDAQGVSSAVQHNAGSSTEWPFEDHEAVGLDGLLVVQSCDPVSGEYSAVLRRYCDRFCELAAKPGEVIGFNIGIGYEHQRWYYMVGEPNTLIPLELR